ncbi:uncharacterized protein LOC131251213 [Magnolia sinica]|uniref:uncharacterized protein LOC131251213 n=1 Tax=Magnolia sinica TaxID=86752 RepID=UPI00265AD6DF|nr:uncharacterized protein LOC131251213 [Magnolia sinica]
MAKNKKGWNHSTGDSGSKLLDVLAKWGWRIFQLFEESQISFHEVHGAAALMAIPKAWKEVSEEKVRVVRKETLAAVRRLMLNAFLVGKTMKQKGSCMKIGRSWEDR